MVHIQFLKFYYRQTLIRDEIINYNLVIETKYLKHLLANLSSFFIADTMNHSQNTITLFLTELFVFIYINSI